MELPKNITQIGEADPHCKVYVEDYVISYIKQLNREARDKSIAIALYGVRKEEAGITYLFFYGACKLHFLQRESRHLSQAVLQEVEKQRRKFFSEYVFLGYRLLDGEMIEGFHVYEQGVCRYIEGYAQFFEKNDSMLAFMLADRKEDARPEEVDREKYETVRKRQEERRALTAENSVYKTKRINRPASSKVTPPKSGNFRKMKIAVAAVFALLCVAGLASMGSGVEMEELQVAARQLIEGMTERQLPDAVEVSNGSVQVGTIVAEDKLTDAILKENEAAVQNDVGQPTEQPSQEPSGTTPPEQQPTSAPTQAPTPVPATAPTEAPTTAPTAAPVSYIVKRGDTLIGICIKTYGSDARVSEICELNQISNPDDIKAGQKILLP